MCYHSCSSYPKIKRDELGLHLLADQDNDYLVIVNRDRILVLAGEQCDTILYFNIFC